MLCDPHACPNRKQHRAVTRSVPRATRSGRPTGLQAQLHLRGHSVTAACWRSGARHPFSRQSAFEVADDPEFAMGGQPGVTMCHESALFDYRLRLPTADPSILFVLTTLVGTTSINARTA
jgi:hypothetical protein